MSVVRSQKPEPPAVDIMDALWKSLEMVRKPPARVRSEKPVKAAKNRRRR
jgi:non-homologous end joining protein Ku